MKISQGCDPKNVEYKMGRTAQFNPTAEFDTTVQHMSSANRPVHRRASYLGVSHQHEGEPAFFIVDLAHREARPIHCNEPFRDNISHQIAGYFHLNIKIAVKGEKITRAGVVDTLPMSNTGRNADPATDYSVLYSWSPWERGHDGPQNTCITTCNSPLLKGGGAIMLFNTQRYIHGVVGWERRS